MCKFDRGANFTFRTKTEANDFCKRMRQASARYDVVVVNDVLKDRGEPLVMNGFHYGYNKKEIKKWKPEKTETGKWQVHVPRPGKMIRDGSTGYWTTESVEDSPKGG